MTAEIVNLNKFRKAREKAEDEVRAGQNRVRYGRTKAEKEMDASEERMKDRTLDGAKLAGRDTTGDGSDPENAQ